ncbi:ShlB/FhaC/HecB family hemolysin secretion/activation protein [Otariodibacter sp.]|uniref:ShlB/FhaC/HecB family hemolysin secretion/activation protein n=1 Tax=Otariodibacter sp. TaxID=3030919 RepID=UPI0026238371|nr:ShlB/FhaC/HecB family hemolysin secretion/activation protein [Otariodibacter sp.]
MSFLAKKEQFIKYSYLYAVALLPPVLNAQETSPMNQELIRLKNKQTIEDSEKGLEQAEKLLSLKQKKPILIHSDIQPINENQAIIKNITIDYSEGPYIDFKQIIKSYEGTNFTNQQILYLVKDLTDILYKKGYVTSAIGLKSTDFSGGNLSLIIHWGKVDQIYIDGEKPNNIKDKLMLSTLPTIKDTIFNIHSIDQIVEILNTTNKKVSIDVIASDKQAYSNLDLTVRRYLLPSINLGFNNSGVGNNENGRNQITTSLNMSDLLGINDSWRLSSGYRLYKKSKKNNQINYAITYTQPFSSYILETTFSHTGYKKNLAGNNGDYSSRGKTQAINSKLSKVLFRDQENIFSIYSEIEFKKKINYIVNRKITNRRENKISIGLSYITNLLNGKLYSDISYSNGIKWHKGESLAYKNTKDENLKLINLNITWLKPLMIKKRIINYQLRLGAQYSPYNLYSDNQLSLGDEYTVRGFKGGILSGESGAYLSQTLSMPFYPQKYLIKYISPFFGFDIGKIYQKVLHRSTSIAGSILGIKTTIGKLDLSISYGKPIIKPNNYNGKEEYYFNANLKF